MNSRNFGAIADFNRVIRTEKKDESTNPDQAYYQEIYEELDTNSIF